MLHESSSPHLDELSKRVDDWLNNPAPFSDTALLINDMVQTIERLSGKQTASRMPKNWIALLNKLKELDEPDKGMDVYECAEILNNQINGVYTYFKLMSNQNLVVVLPGNKIGPYRQSKRIVLTQELQDMNKAQFNEFIANWQRRKRTK